MHHGQYPDLCQFLARSEAGNDCWECATGKAVSAAERGDAENLTVQYHRATMEGEKHCLPISLCHREFTICKKTDHSSTGDGFW